jgi:UDP-N-acetylmuramoyl-tripeptide--D-alanyl-D-alanine ligase
MNPINSINSINTTNSVNTTNRNKMAVRWGEITIGEIVAAMGGSQISGSPDRAAQGLCTDSRTMVPGHLFLALKGERYDGHDFLGEAVGAGAGGLIVEAGRPIREGLSDDNMAVITVSSTLKALGDLASWWRRKWGRTVIAITGSNGKSTTKEMAATILSLKAKTMKSPGNFNNLIGLPLSILGLEPHHELAVLEMGMNVVGEIARLTRIAGPEIGVITNVASAHLEALSDLEGVAEAKGELLREMSTQSTAILNGDNELTRGLASSFEGRTVTFGLGAANRVRAEDIRRVGDSSQSFAIRIDGERIPATIHLPGVHNVLNALAGAAIAGCVSLPSELIARGLGDFRPLKGRFQILELKGGIRVIDDTYNANPSSLGAAIQTIEEVREKGQGLVVGLGEMLELGVDAPRYHFDAGKRIAVMGTRFLAVLGEHGHQVIEGACKEGMVPAQTFHASDHEEMIEAIRANVREGDVVFLKGSRRVALDRVVDGLKESFGMSEEQENAV